MSEYTSSPSGSSNGKRIAPKYGNRPYRTSGAALDRKIKRDINVADYRSFLGSKENLGIQLSQDESQFYNEFRPGAPTSGSAVSTKQVSETDSLSYKNEQDSLAKQTEPKIEQSQAATVDSSKNKMPGQKKAIQQPIVQQEPAAEPQIQAPTPPRKNSYLYNTYSSVARANLGVRISGLASDNMQRSNILNSANNIWSMLDKKNIDTTDSASISEYNEKIEMLKDVINISRAKKGLGPIKDTVGKESSPVYRDFDDDISGPNMMQSRGGRIPMQNNSVESAHKREEALAASNRKYINAMSDFGNMADRGPASSLSSGRYIQRHKNIHVDDRSWSQKPLGVKILDSSVYATLGLTSLAAIGFAAYALAPGAFALGNAPKVKNGVDLYKNLRKLDPMLRSADKIKKAEAILAAGTAATVYKNAVSDQPLSGIDVLEAYGSAAMFTSVGTLSELVKIGAINSIPGVIGYVASPRTNFKDDDLHVESSDLPERSRDLFKKYEDDIRQYYRASTDKVYGSDIPNIEDLVYGKDYSGKGIISSGDTNLDLWIKDVSNKIEKDIRRSEIKIEKNRISMNSIDEPDDQWVQDNKIISNLSQGIGASLGDAKAMGAMAAANIAITRGMPRLYKAGGIKPGAGAFISGSLMLGINGVMSVYSRGIEASAQMYDSKIVKISEYVNKLKPGLIPDGRTILDIDDESLVSMLTDSGFDSAKSEYYKNGALSEKTRQEVLDDMLTGKKNWLDGSGKSALYSAEEGSRSAMNQYMSLVIPESITAGMITGSFTTKNLRGAIAKDNSIIGSASEWVDNLANITYRRAMKSASNSRAGLWWAKNSANSWVMRNAESAGRLAVKGIGKSSIEAIQESFLEENPQFVISKNYENNFIKDSFNPISALANTYVDASTAGRALLGISGDHRFDSNPELIDNFKLSMLLGGVMGGMMSAPMEVLSERDRRKDVAIRAYIKNNIIDNLKTNNTVERSKQYLSTNKSDIGSGFDTKSAGDVSVYMDRKVVNERDRVMSAFDAAIEKLTEAKTDDNLLKFMDIDKENIDKDIAAIKEEKKRASRIYALADSKSLSKYAKESGGKYGDNHAIAVALAIDYEDKANESGDQILDRIKALNSKIEESNIREGISNFIKDWNDSIDREMEEYKNADVATEFDGPEKPTRSKIKESEADNLLNTYLELRALMAHHGANTLNRAEGDKSDLTAARISYISRRIADNVRAINKFHKDLKGEGLYSHDGSSIYEQDVENTLKALEDFGISGVSDEMLADSLNLQSSIIDLESNTIMSSLISNSVSVIEIGGKRTNVRRYDLSDGEQKTKYFARLDNIVNAYREARKREDDYIRNTKELEIKANQPPKPSTTKGVESIETKVEPEKQEVQAEVSADNKTKRTVFGKDSRKAEIKKARSIESNPDRDYESGVEMFKMEESISDEIIDANSEVIRELNDAMSAESDPAKRDQIRGQIAELEEETNSLRAMSNAYYEIARSFMRAYDNDVYAEKLQNELSVPQAIGIVGRNTIRTVAEALNMAKSVLTLRNALLEEIEDLRNKKPSMLSSKRKINAKIESMLDRVGEIDRFLERLSTEVGNTIFDFVNRKQNAQDGNTGTGNAFDSSDDKDTVKVSPDPKKEEDGDSTPPGEDEDYEEAGEEPEKDEDEQPKAEETGEESESDESDDDSDLGSAFEKLESEATKTSQERRAIVTDEKLATLLESGDAIAIENYLNAHPELTSGVAKSNRSRIARTFFMTSAGEDTLNFLYNIKSFKNVKARIEVKSFSKDRNQTDPNLRTVNGKSTYRVGRTFREGKLRHTFSVDDSNRNLNHGFNRELEDTYDNALILMYITYTDTDTNGKPVEKTVRFQLMHPGDAATQANLVNADENLDQDYVFQEKDRRFSDKEVQDLREYRASIIKAHNDAIEMEKAKPGTSARVVFKSGIEYGEQRVNVNKDDRGRVVYSKVDDNSGLLPEGMKARDVSINDVELAYNRGEWGAGTVVSGESVIGVLPASGGSMVMTFRNDSSESGRSFAYLAKSSNGAIEKKNPGKNSIVDAIYKMVVKYGGNAVLRFEVDENGNIFDSNGNLTQSTTASKGTFLVSDLLKRMIRFGNQTKIYDSENDFSSEAAVEHQFYIDSNGSARVLHVGDKEIILPDNIEDISPESEKVIKDFIRSSNTPISMSDLFNSDKSSDNKVSDVFPFAKEFFDSNPKVDRIFIADGFSINRSDLDISWTGWVFENERLMSIYGVPPVTPSYIYGTDPIAMAGSKDGFDLISKSQTPSDGVAPKKTTKKASKKAKESLDELKRLKSAETGNPVSGYYDEFGNSVSLYEQDGELWERVTTVKEEDLGKKGKKLGTLEKIRFYNNMNALPVGDMYDSFMRFFFDNISRWDEPNQKLYDDFVEFTKKIKAGNYEQMDNLMNIDEFKNLSSIASSILTSLNGMFPDGFSMVTDEILLKQRNGGNKSRKITLFKKDPDGGPNMIEEEVSVVGVAGTPDMIVVDNEGVYHIFDFKTGVYSTTNPVHTISQDKANDMLDTRESGWVAQQSIYKDMLEANTGKKVASINIVFSPVSYVRDEVDPSDPDALSIIENKKQHPFRIVQNGRSFNVFGAPIIKNLRYAKSKGMAERALVDPSDVSEAKDGQPIESSVKTGDQMVMDGIKDPEAYKPSEGPKRRLGGKIGSGANKLRKEDRSGMPQSREIGKSAIDPIDENAVKSLFTKRFGGSEPSIEFIDDVIGVSNGLNVVGLTHIDGITMSALASNSDAFHEAFHWISLMIMSRKDRMKMYSNFRKKNESHKNSTDNEIEEILAEEFRLAYLDKLASEGLVKDDLVKSIFPSSSLFGRITRAISFRAGLNKADTNLLLRAFNNGYFDSKAKNKLSELEFSIRNKTYTHGKVHGMTRLGSTARGNRAVAAALSEVKTEEDLDFVLSSMICELFHMGDVRVPEDVDNIRFQDIKDSALYTAQSILDEYYGDDQEAMKDSRYRMALEIVRRFDDFYKKELIDKLSSIKVATYEKDVLEEGEGEDALIGETLRHHTVESFKVSKEETSSFEFKFFLSSIPMYSEDSPYEDGFVRSPKHGMLVPYQYDDIKDAVYRELHDARTPQEMIDKIADLALNKKNDMFFSLYNIMTEMDLDFHTRFWINVYTSRNDFNSVIYNSEADNDVDSAYEPKSLRVINDLLDRDTKRLPIQWGANLINSESIFKNTEDGLVYDNEKAQSIQDRYTNIVLDIRNIRMNDSSKKTNDKVKKILNRFAALVNEMGINFDESSIMYAIGEIGGSSNMTYAEKVKELITSNTKGGGLFTSIIPSWIKMYGPVQKTNAKTSASFEKLSRIRSERAVRTLNGKKIYGGKDQVKYFAEIYSMSHMDQRGNMAYGADGKPVYAISDRSAVNDILGRLSSDQGYVDRLLSSSINKGSLLINAAKRAFSSKNKLRLKMDPFLKMFEESSSDKGRAYFDLTPAEDYVMKMTMLLDKKIILPTMADKSTWGTIPFDELFDFVSKGDSAEGIGISVNVVEDVVNGVQRRVKSVRYVYPERLIQILHTYMKSEFDAITEAWGQYKLAVDENGDIDYTKLIPGYHYDPKNKDGIFNGRGMRFRYIDTLVNTTENSLDETGSLVPGKKELINLNDMMMEKISIAIERAKMEKSDVYESIDLALSDIRNNFFKFSEDGGIDSGIRDGLAEAFTWHVEKEMEYAQSLGVTTQRGYLTADNGLYDRATVKRLRAKLKDAYSSVNGIDIDISNKAATFTLFANSSINHIISEFEVDKVISKDLAFYKTPDDKTKRLSSALSTGKKFRTEFPSDHPLHGKDTYTVLELNDFIRPSDTLEKMRNYMYNSVVNRLIDRHNATRDKNTTDRLESLPDLDIMLARMSADEIKELRGKYSDIFSKADAEVEKILIPYSDINVTDGMAYASVDMLKSLLTRSGVNVHTPTMSRVFQIMESDNLDWMNKEPDGIIQQVYELMYHPRKLIYFGDHVREFSDGTSLSIPKLNKMAVFVLPKFLATGDLGALYERMTKESPDKTDMAIFSSAIKVNSEGGQDIYERDESGRQDDSRPLTDISKTPNGIQRFEYLRLQMPTDPHKTAKINVSTQPIKASMSNIEDSETFNVPGYGEMNGAQLKKEWSMAMAEISNRGRDKVKKMFGASFNFNTGEIEYDKVAIAKYLLEQGRKSIKTTPDVISQLSEFVDDPLSFPNFSFEAFFDNDRMEEQIVSFIMKETLRNKMPGGMMIQMSPFGLKKTTDKNVSYIVNGGKKLEFNRDDMSVEAAVSINLFKDIIPSDVIGFAARRKWLIDSGIIGQNASPSSIGYRVPSQGRPSISALTIVDVLPEQIGDTIVLPYEFTGMNGSDFDIDKLFISRYNYDVSNGEAKVVEMDDSLPNKWKNNTIESIQNRLLSIMMASITNKNMISDSRYSIDSTVSIIKEDVLPYINDAYKEDPDKTPFSFASLSYESQKKVDYMNGAAGIGPYALASVHHVLGQITGLGVTNSKVMKKYAIRSLDGIYDFRMETRILDVFSALINAHVDIANDPYIMRAGINPYTHKMAAFLVRAGFGTNTFFFLSQQGIKDAYALANRNSSEYLRSSYDDVKPSGFERALRDTIALYKKELNSMPNGSSYLSSVLDSNGSVVDGMYMYTDSLRNNLKKKNTPEWYAFQIRVMQTYLELSRPANSLSSVVKYSQIDTRKQGSTASDHRLFKHGIDQLVQGASKTHISGVQRLFDNSFLGDMLGNSSGLVKGITRNMFIRTTEAGERAVDIILNALGKSNEDSRELAKKIISDINSLVKSKYYENLLLRDHPEYVSADRNNPERKIALKALLGGLFFGGNSIDRRFNKIKEAYPEIVKNNAFFVHMIPSGNPINSRKNISTLTTKNNVSDNYVTIDQMKRHFSTLLNSEIDEIRNFAKDYLVYRFYTSGDNFSPKNIKTSEYDREDLGFYEFMDSELSRAINNPYSYLTDQDLEEIFINKWYDSDYVKYVSISKKREIREEYDFGERSYDYEFLPSLDRSDNSSDNYISTGIFVENQDGTRSQKIIRYATAFIDSNQKDRIIKNIMPGVDGFRSDWRPAPYLKVLAKESVSRLEYGLAEKEYILYKLSSIIIDSKNGVRLPIYHAIGKKGSYSNGIRYNEIGLSSSNIVTNNLKGMIKDEDTAGALKKFASNSSHNLDFLDYYNRESNGDGVSIVKVNPLQYGEMPGSITDESGDMITGENLGLIINQDAIDSVAFRALHNLMEAMSSNPSEAISDIAGFIEESIAENGISQKPFVHSATYRYGELVSEYAATYNGSSRYSKLGTSSEMSLEYFQKLSSYASRVMEIYENDSNGATNLSIDVESTVSDVLSDMLNKLNNNTDFDPQSNC